MKERLVHFSLTIVDPDDAAGLSVLEAYFTALVKMTIVAVSVAPSIDEGSGTLDIDDDGVNVISGIVAATQNTPGTWISTRLGGTETPVVIAQGSLVSFDFNSYTIAVSAIVDVWYFAN